MLVLKAFFLACGLAVALSVSADRLCARQESCTHIGTPGSESLLGWIHNSDSSCIVTEDGAYVQRFKAYKLHARAIATGHCTRRGWDCSPPLPCDCVPLAVGAEEDRAVVHISAAEYNSQPSSPFSEGGMSPVGGNQQVMDSRSPGTTTPEGLSWTPFYLGVSTLRFTSTIHMTACNLTPGSVVFNRSVNVVQCAPRFDPVLERLPLDGQPIKIVGASDPALNTAAQTASQEWEAALGNYGLQVDFSVVPGGCQPLDDHCIQVVVQNPPNPIACSATAAHLGPDGVIDERTTLYVRPAYAGGGWSQAFLNHVFAHEIGHLLGLENLTQGDCSNQSIMKEAVTCNNMTGLTQVPTAGDAKAVANTTYGTGSRQSCR
jgi:hypothetical protein